MNRKGPRRLGDIPYRIVEDDSDSDSATTTDWPPNFMANNVFEAFSWKGRPRTKRKEQTPILYHKGTWKAFHGYAPDAAEPVGASPFWRQAYDLYQAGATRSSPAAVLTATQYGNGFVETGNPKRVPTAVLFNLVLGTNATAGKTPRAFTTADEQAALDEVAGYFTALSAALEAKDVFVAPLYDDTALSNYLTAAFPGYDWIEDEASAAAFGHGGSATNESGVRRLIDPSRFTGGNLLVLYGITTYQQSAITTGAYYKLDFPGPTATTWDSGQRVAYETSVLQSAYARFNKYRCIVYVREYRNTADEIARSDVLTPLHNTLIDSLAAYGLVRRGPYDYDEDISAIIQADVQTFLGEI
jgi:hypothetical protein